MSALKTVEDIVADVDSVLAGESNSSNQPRQSAAPGYSATRKDRKRHSGEHKLRIRMWSKDQRGSWNTALGNLEHVGGDIRQTISREEDIFRGSHRYANSASALSTRKNRNRQSESTHVHTGRTTSAISKRANDTGTVQVITV